MNTSQRILSPNGSNLNSLHVTGIPEHENNIIALNQFFSKYGTVTHINVLHNGDRHAALVTFARYEQAAQAINGLKNSPLIQVAWHQEKQSGCPCEKCGKLLASKQSLKMHMIRMHAGDRCDTCNIRFETRAAYEKHCNVHHLNMNSSAALGNQSIQSSSTAIGNQSIQSSSTALGNQSIFSTSMFGTDKSEKLNKLKLKYISLKRKYKKHDKLKLKMMKKAAKTQKSLNQIIKEQADLLSEKDSTLEKERQTNTDISMKLADEQRKVEQKEAALQLLQQEISKLSQNLLNEQSKVSMLKQTLSMVYNGSM